MTFCLQRMWGSAKGTIFHVRGRTACAGAMRKMCANEIRETKKWNRSSHLPSTHTGATKTIQQNMRKKRVHNSLFVIGRWHAHRTRIYELWTSLVFSCPFYSFFLLRKRCSHVGFCCTHWLTSSVTAGKCCVRWMVCWLLIVRSDVKDTCQRHRFIGSKCTIIKSVIHAASEKPLHTHRLEKSALVNFVGLLATEHRRPQKMFRFLLTNDAISRSSHCVLTWRMRHAHNDCRNRATEMTTILPLWMWPCVVNIYFIFSTTFTYS